MSNDDYNVPVSDGETTFKKALQALSIARSLARCQNVVSEGRCILCARHAVISVENDQSVSRIEHSVWCPWLNARQQFGEL